MKKASGRNLHDTVKFVTMFQLKMSSTGSKNQWHAKSESVAHRQKPVTHQPQIGPPPTTNQSHNINKSAAHQTQISSTPATTQQHTSHKSAAQQPQSCSTPTTKYQPQQQHTNHKSVSH
jgi:hypothetical protein